MANFSTFTRFCLTVLLWPPLLLLFIGCVPILILTAILRNTEALLYHLLYRARIQSPTDCLWTMGSDKNSLDINGCMILDGELSIDKFTRLLNECMIKAKNDNGERIYWQTTKYIVPGYINYYWIEEENFSLEEHIRQVHIEPITSEKDLQGFLRNGSTREYPCKSPWSFSLIPYLENGKRKTVIHYRISHAISDGVSLAYFLLFRLAEYDNPVDHLIKKRIVHSSPKYLQRHKLILGLNILWTIPLVLLENLILKKEMNDFDDVSITGDNTICWSKPFDLTAMRNVKDTLNATINDIQLGCCTKSIRDVFCEFNKYCPREFSVTMPFNMRLHIDEAKEFKNQFTGLLVQLPTHQADLISDILEMKNRMDHIKFSCQTFASNIVFKLMVYMLIPEFLCRKVVLDAVGNASLATSCLVGPRDKIRINGHVVESIMYWSPPAPGIGAFVGFCSYNNEVRFGVGIDRALFFTAEKLIEIFERNMDEICNM